MTIYANVVNVRSAGKDVVLEFGSFFPDSDQQFLVKGRTPLAQVSRRSCSYGRRQIQRSGRTGFSRYLFAEPARRPVGHRQVRGLTPSPYSKTVPKRYLLTRLGMHSERRQIMPEGALAF
jgi:hypothetical protein